MEGLDTPFSHTIHCPTHFPHTIPQFEYHLVHWRIPTFHTLIYVPHVHFFLYANIRLSFANQYSPCLVTLNALYAFTFS
jgi:hypothetical protein